MTTHLPDDPRASSAGAPGPTGGPGEPASGPPTVPVEVPVDVPVPVPGTLAPAAGRMVAVGWVFAVLAALMVPWTAYLALALPGSHQAAHYDLAWGGFDVGLLAVLAATAVAAVRRSRWLPVSSAALATMLLVDAWFDVVTAPTRDELLAALAMALLVELPLAAVCGWLAVRGQSLLEHRIALRSRRRSGLRHPS
ncbi:hypothetical protein [Phycicoccus sp. SLBN-51]|uniref:hypothetical protein n=1 Tax=Phycicoccus sp. SLBN-51 TaxID=2768447 RepID=UPI001151851A|nr:hypothetical protein [Phycicoccus sp. SLBN-51]TQJ51559.1 hypothetical protein FBY26_3295 [Phycicoccus sp. SLBN-51]